jgi:hypothetical protein
MWTPTRRALILLVGLVSLISFFASGLVVGLLVAMCSARKRDAGVVAKQMVLHLFQEWEQSGHALVEDGRMLGVVGGEALAYRWEAYHCFSKTAGNSGMAFLPVHFG